MNRLRHMSVFAHIIEAGSITAAAEQLELSKSVISQHLKALETELGITLLKRTTRRQSLTPAGAAFYKECKKLNSVAELAWQQALETQQHPQGRITITASDALMATLVAPAIGQLMHQYPNLKPELISDDKPLNLMTSNIDLAIRVGPSSEDALMQRRIGEFRDVLCGHKNVVENSGDNSGYIANHWQSKHIHHNFEHGQTHGYDYIPRVTCRVDSFHTCLTLLEAGVGIGLVPDYIFEQKRNTLTLVFPDYQLPRNPIYALHPYSRNTPLNIKVCIEAIESQLKQFNLGINTKNN